MTTTLSPTTPPCCPNPGCFHHRNPAPQWRFVRDGTYSRSARPQRIQRYRCSHCGRRFSQQSFRATYWMRRPELLGVIFRRLVGCSGYRQIGRELGVSPSTVMGQAARLGRHCLLVHAERRPTGRICEPLVLDGFVSFEYSQYHPTEFHTVVGARSHYVYGVTESELRRSGRMTVRQRQRRKPQHADDDAHGAVGHDADGGCRHLRRHRERLWVRERLWERFGQLQRWAVCGD